MDLILNSRILATMALIAGFGLHPAFAAMDDAALPGHGSPFIAHFDEDGDSLVSSAEFPGPSDHFSQMMQK